MGLTNEHVGPKILAKIKIYVLTRAELLFVLCYEIHTHKGKVKINMKFTYRSVFEATLAKENTSFKSKSMNKSGNDDLNGSALELQPIMDNQALIHNRVRIYQFRDIGRHINLGAR